MKGIENITAPTGETVFLEKSNISSMTTGQDVANQIIPSLSQLIECINSQCATFKQLAESIEQRDAETKFSERFEV